MNRNSSRKTGVILLGPLLLGLLLAVACGTAATATPLPATAPAPANTGQPVATAVPQATAAPATLAVNQGKVIWMMSGWGNGRFTANYGVGSGSSYGRIIHGGIIATNENSELLPGIATKWEISPDGKTWTFTIRDGGKFQDGKAITAEDVWWSWMHFWGKDESGAASERATSTTALGIARLTEKIELIAPNQVSQTLKYPDAGWPGRISEAGPNWWGVVPKRPKVHDTAQEEAYDKNPIGSGPGKLIKHIQSDLMAFERFDDYYYQPKIGLPEDRRLKFRYLDLRLVPEEATRVAAVRAGEADIAPISLSSRKQLESSGGRVVFGPQGSYIFGRVLRCYLPQYPCHDKRVRQAFDLAINKNIIRDQLYGGPEVFQVKGWSFVTPSSIGYSPDLDPRPQDTDKARQLLADAGYPGGKGFGKVIINTWVSSAVPFLPESAQLVADSWRRELGLEVEVKVGDQAAVSRATLTNELDGQVLWRDNEARVDPSSGYDTPYATRGAASRLHDDPAIFDLMEQTFGVIEPNKRSDAFHQAHLRIRDESYDWGIGYVNVPWAVGPRVTVWQPWPLSFYPNNLHGIVLK